MIRLLITLCLVLSLVSCTSTPTRPFKKSTSNKSFSSKSAKKEEYKRKIAALEKKTQKLEKKKSEPIEVESPQEVSEPQEVSLPQEVFVPKEVSGLKKN